METPAVPDVRIVRTGMGAVEEFTVFAQVSGPALYRIAHLLCGDEHRAKDLVQLALERTYRARGRVGDGEPFAYARRVLATARIDSWRRTRRETVRDVAADDRRTVPDSAVDVAERPGLASLRPVVPGPAGQPAGPETTGRSDQASPSPHALPSLLLSSPGRYAGSLRRIGSCAPDCLAWSHVQ